MNGPLGTLKEGILTLGSKFWDNFDGPGVAMKASDVGYGLWEDLKKTIFG